MINFFINKYNIILAIAFHVLLGFLCTLSPLFLILWFYFFLVVEFLNLNKQKFYNKDLPLIRLIVYTVSFELLARMSLTSPYIPYELSKYLMFVFFIYGIIRRNNSYKFGIVYVLLLFPSIFIDISNSVEGYEPYSFNLLGPINVGLAIMYFGKQKILEEDYKDLFFLLLLPTISVLSFTYIKTPDFKTFEFNLAANFATSGGFGSNQVSTILGLGMLISFIILLNSWVNKKLSYLFLILFFAFAFQGLITFSRGGMIGGAISMLIILFTINSASVSTINLKSISFSKIFVLILIVLLSFMIADGVSGGLLTKRYQGETEGTLSGYKEQNINNITTNRYDIFVGDLLLWKEYPLFGVGIGASKSLRTLVNDVVAHVELSRLLAEHGLFGFFYFVLLLIIPLKLILRNNNKSFKYIMFSVFVLAIFTTFHAGMRTFVTPILIGLSVIKPVYKGYSGSKTVLSKPALS